MRCVIELRLITLSFALRGEGTKDGVLVILSLFMPEVGLLSPALPQLEGRSIGMSSFPLQGLCIYFNLVGCINT